MSKNENDLLRSVSDVATDKPVTIEVEVLPRNRVHALMQKWGLRPKKRVFHLRPITLGNLIRISKILVDMDLADFSLENILESNYKAITRHSVDMARVVAIALHNRKQEPTEELVNFILDNFSPKELLSTLAIVLRQMDVTSFMSSIISMKGLNVLERSKLTEMSPAEQGS